MGSSPIARSIYFSERLIPSAFRLPSKLFISAWLFGFALAGPVLAQVDPDTDRPFGLGRVLLLPATTDYLGDIVHPIDILDDPFLFHTPDGILVEEVGSVGPAGSSQIGLRALPMGILFEGIPYPLLSTAILNWMPATGTMEYLNFPSTGWWGPSTSGGAVQIIAPDLTRNETNDSSIWGGEGGHWGVNDIFQYPWFSLEGNYRNGEMTGFPSSATMSFSSKERWVQSDSMNVESGLLVSDEFSGDYWYAGFADIKYLGSNFQSLQIKPYFQLAETENQSVREVGAYLNYLFDFAGLAQSHLGAGFSHDDFQSSSLEKGFVQTTDFADVLGFATLDFAIRVDFSSTGPAMFSTIVGTQASQGLFTFLGDYDKAVLETSYENIQQADIGLKCQFQDQWLAELEYVLEQNGTTYFNGARGQVVFEKDDKFFAFKRLKLELNEQLLQDTSGAIYYDTGCKLMVGLFENNHFWANGRVLSGQSFYSEIGLEIGITKKLKCFVSVANLDNHPISWPDPDLSLGRVFWIGLKGDF